MQSIVCCVFHNSFGYGRSYSGIEGSKKSDHIPPPTSSQTHGGGGKADANQGRLWMLGFQSHGRGLKKLSVPTPPLSCHGSSVASWSGSKFCVSRRTQTNRPVSTDGARCPCIFNCTDCTCLVMFVRTSLHVPQNILVQGDILVC